MIKIYRIEGRVYAAESAESAYSQHVTGWRRVEMLKGNFPPRVSIFVEHPEVDRSGMGLMEFTASIQDAMAREMKGSLAGVLRMPVPEGTPEDQGKVPEKHPDGTGGFATFVAEALGYKAEEEVPQGPGNGKFVTFVAGSKAEEGVSRGRASSAEPNIQNLSPEGGRSERIKRLEESIDSLNKLLKESQELLESFSNALSKKDEELAELKARVKDREWEISRLRRLLKASEA